MDYAVNIDQWNIEIDPFVRNEDFSIIYNHKLKTEFIVIATSREGVLRILKECDYLEEEMIWIFIRRKWRKWKIPWTWSKTKMVFG